MTTDTDKFAADYRDASVAELLAMIAHAEANIAELHRQQRGRYSRARANELAELVERVRAMTHEAWRGHSALKPTRKA